MHFLLSEPFIKSHQRLTIDKLTFLYPI